MAIVVTILAIFVSTMVREASRKPAAPARNLAAMAPPDAASDDSDESDHFVIVNARTALIRR